jgi:hypothetical protein
LGRDSFHGAPSASKIINQKEWRATARRHGLLLSLYDQLFCNVAGELNSLCKWV